MDPLGVQTVCSVVALLRLAGSVLVEADGECQVADRRYLSEAILAVLNTTCQSEQNVAAPAVLTAY